MFTIKFSGIEYRTYSDTLDSLIEMIKDSKELVEAKIFDNDGKCLFSYTDEKIEPC